MPIRRPEHDHAALFNAHRRNRHLGAAAEAPAVDPASPAPPASMTVPAPEAPPKVANFRSGVAITGSHEPTIGGESKSGAPGRRRNHTPHAASATCAADEMMTIKIVVPYPAPGTSAALDALADEIGEDAAVRSLLRRAFDELRREVEAGEMPGVVPAYRETDKTVATTRRISRRAYDTAAQDLDPARLLSARAFARLLARRALARFFEAEQRSAARGDRRG